MPTRGKTPTSQLTCHASRVEGRDASSPRFAALNPSVVRLPMAARELAEGSSGEQSHPDRQRPGWPWEQDPAVDPHPHEVERQAGDARSVVTASVVAAKLPLVETS